MDSATCSPDTPWHHFQASAVVLDARVGGGGGVEVGFDVYCGCVEVGDVVEELVFEVMGEVVGFGDRERGVDLDGEVGA